MPKRVKSVLTSRGGHIRYHNVFACSVYVLKISKKHVFSYFSSDSINLHKGVTILAKAYCNNWAVVATRWIRLADLINEEKLWPHY